MPTPHKGTTPNATCHPERKMWAKGLCKSCYSKKRNVSAKYRQDGRSKHPEYKIKWSKTPKGIECGKNAWVKYRYGIRRDEYDALRKASNGICAICRKPMDMDLTKRGADSAVLDHAHDSKKVREFIHRRCNVGIGFLQEDPVVCRLAAEYLEKHRG